MAYEDLLDELKADDIPLNKIDPTPNNPRFTGSDWQYIPTEMPLCRKYKKLLASNSFVSSVWTNFE